MTNTQLQHVPRRPSGLAATVWVVAGFVGTLGIGLLWTWLRDGLRLSSSNSTSLALLFAAILLWQALRNHVVYLLACLSGATLSFIGLVAWFFWAWSRSSAW